MTTAKRTAGRIPAWLSFAMVAASLGVLIWLVGTDLSALETLKLVTPLEVVLILVLQSLYLLPESYRQQVVVESAADIRLPVWRWFRIFVVGRFLNGLIPQAGNVYRALRLRADFGVAYVDFVGAMVLFLMLSVGLNLTLAAILMAVEAPDVSYGPVPAPWALAIAAIIVIGLPIALAALLRIVSISDAPLFAPLRVLRDLLTSAATAFRQTRLVVLFVLAWAATLGVVIALYASVLSVVGADINVGEVVALYALVQVTSFVVITPGNVGIQELGFAGLAAVFGVPVAQGAIAAAIIRATGWIAVAIPAIALGSADILAAFRGREERETNAGSRG